jgi:hypothetical protein
MDREVASAVVMKISDSINPIEIFSGYLVLDLPIVDASIASVCVFQNIFYLVCSGSPAVS